MSYIATQIWGHFFTSYNLWCGSKYIVLDPDREFRPSFFCFDPDPFPRIMSYRVIVFFNYQKKSPWRIFFSVDLLSLWMVIFVFNLTLFACSPDPQQCRKYKNWTKKIKYPVPWEKPVSSGGRNKFLFIQAYSTLSTL